MCPAWPSLWVSDEAQRLRGDRARWAVALWRASPSAERHPTPRGRWVAKALSQAQLGVGGASLMDGIEMGSREILSDAYYILRPPISTKDHPKCHGRLFPISSWRSHGVLLFYSPGGVSSIVDRFKKGEVFQHTWTSHLRYNHTSWTSWSENPFQRKPLGPPCGGANSMEIDSVYSSRFRKVLVCSWLGVVDINAWRPSISARRRTAGRFR